MKAVIQRVGGATLSVDNKIISQIGKGLVVYFCVEKGDDEKLCDVFAKKLAKFRIFSDDNGKMNLALGDVGGEFRLCHNLLWRQISRKAIVTVFSTQRNLLALTKCITKLHSCWLIVVLQLKWVCLAQI